jgi:hypothetical protein
MRSKYDNDMKIYTNSTHRVTEKPGQTLEEPKPKRSLGGVSIASFSIQRSVTGLSRVQSPKTFVFVANNWLTTSGKEFSIDKSFGK